MPPKKRKAASSTVLPTRTKRVRIGCSSVTDDASEVSASGRPKRSTSGEPNYDQTSRHSGSITVKPEPKGAVTTKATKRGLGRPRKLALTSSAPTKKPVGRPPKIATHVEVPTKPRGRQKEAPVKTAKTHVPSTVSVPQKATGKPGRSKRDQASTTQDLDGDSTGATGQEAERKGAEQEEKPEIEDDRQFWLMKAEPESRIEKGHDVKFAIDDLMNASEPEGWDGVRNFVARNNMRAMREGDLAFFYHSNCAIPGIAGIMQITQEHSVDESAFDPNHPYYDPKSDRSKPKWDLVHVVGQHKFANLVTLKELKAHMNPGQPLENMQTLKQSRLSVSSVTPKEWNFIMDLSGEDFE